MQLVLHSFQVKSEEKFYLYYFCVDQVFVEVIVGDGDDDGCSGSIGSSTVSGSDTDGVVFDEMNVRFCSELNSIITFLS